jgi:copper resistance protein D
LLWFLRDIDLLTILARAATLSFEALLLGGIAYLFAVAKPASASWAVESFCRKGVEMAALALIAAELVMFSAAGFVLVSGSGLSLEDVFTTNFFRVDCFAIVFAIGLCISARFKGSKATVVMLLLSALLIASAVSTSHAAARIHDRVL